MLRYKFYFFFNITATTKFYTLSLRDALPIFRVFALFRPLLPTQRARGRDARATRSPRRAPPPLRSAPCLPPRSEEHTSELQSRQYLVCRLLLEKKKKIGQSHL